MTQSHDHRPAFPGTDRLGHQGRHGQQLAAPQPAGRCITPAVLGAGDGLITNVSLILGVAGASTSASQVRLAGIAGLLAGAFSMAAGELVSAACSR